MAERRSAQRSTSGAVSSTNATTGLRSTTRPGAASLSRMSRSYGSRGSRVARQFTVRGGSAARMSGS